jgi:hypothetical protein
MIAQVDGSYVAVIGHYADHSIMWSSLRTMFPTYCYKAIFSLLM